MPLGSQIAASIAGAVVNSVLGTFLQGLAGIAIKPVTQKLESTGFFNLDAADVIGQYGEDLVVKAKQGNVQRVTGRDREIDTLIAELRKGANPCVIGEAGVGKTALVEGLAVKIAKGEVPDEIKDWQIIKVDFPSLIVGKGYGGDPNAGLIRLRALFEYAKKHPNVVVFIDEVHQFASFADLCKTYLDRSQIKLVGATTLKEFSMYLSKDPALERRFQKIFIEEPDIQVAFDIVKDRVEGLEKKFNVKVKEDVLYKNSILTARYLPFRPSPDKEVKNLATACELASREADMKFKADNPKVENKESSSKKSKEKATTLKREPAEVTEVHVREAISLSSNIPANVPSSQEFAKLVTMSARFKNKLIGQDNIVDTVCEVIKRARLEMNDPDKIRGTFLFAGPSGVGKTYLARMLGAEIGRNIFIDASQFNGEMRKALIDEIKNTPYCEIVFDGIDKAKPAVLSEIISIIDSGFMLDSTGRKVDFKNTVIVLTANTGKEVMTKEEMKNALINKLGIEPISKVDNVLFFDALSDQSAQKLVKSNIINICSLLNSRFNIKIEYNEDIINLIVKNSLALEQGANGIAKYIYNNIFNVLTGKLTSGTIKPGQNIMLKCNNNSIICDVVQSIEKS